MNKKIKSLFVFFLFTLSVCGLEAQEITLKALLTSMESKSEDEFLKHIEPFKICFHSTFSDSSYTYFRHINCGKDSLTGKRLTVMYAIGKDGVYNSSFSTRNEKFANKIMAELSTYNFKKIHTPADEEQSELIQWYHSEDYPNLNLMWEIYYDDNKRKVWHIGLVWTQYNK